MVVKMAAAAVAAVALLLLCCSVTATKGCDTHAASNGNFSLSHNLNLDASDTLKWYHNNKMVYRGQGGKVFTNVYPVDAKGSLKLINVDMSREGLYKAEVINEEGKTKSEKVVKLCLMDPVTKLKLTMECFPPTTVKFTCSVKAKDPDITWIQNNEVLKKEKKTTLVRQAKDILEDKIKCKVSNLVSSQTSEPLTQDCYKSTLFGLETWIMMVILGGGGGLVLVLIVIVIICCCRTRRKKTMKVKEEEELRLGWANSQQQQQQQQQHYHQSQCHHPPSTRHHPHRQQQQQQQQPPGHTGPRQHRSKPPRDPQKDAQPQLPRPRGQPRPSPRGPSQGSKAADGEEQPPPLPQPRRTTNKVV